MIDETVLLKRLENLGWVYADYYPDETAINRKRKKSVAYDDVIKIIKDLESEQNNGRISCEEKLSPQPKFPEDTYLTQQNDITTPYSAYWDGFCWWTPCERDESTINCIDDISHVDIDGEVIAWDKMSKLYKSKLTDMQEFPDTWKQHTMNRFERVG